MFYVIIWCNVRKFNTKVEVLKEVESIVLAYEKKEKSVAKSLGLEVIGLIEIFSL
jgi:hypothetical protein